MSILYTIRYYRKRLSGDAVEYIEEIKHGMPGRLVSTMKHMLGDLFISSEAEMPERRRSKRSGPYDGVRTHSPSEGKRQRARTHKSIKKAPARTLGEMISEEAEKYQ